jgi:hypothetical protein
VDVGADLTPGGDAAPETASSTKSASGRDGGSTSKGGDPDDEPSHVASLGAFAASRSSSPMPAAAAPPTLDIRARFGANLFLLSGKDLAHVIMRLEQECPHALEHVTEEVEVEYEDGGQSEKTVSPKLEINVDEIDPKVFTELVAYVADKLGAKGAHHLNSMQADDNTSTGTGGRAKKKKRTS